MEFLELPSPARPAVTSRAFAGAAGPWPGSPPDRTLGAQAVDRRRARRRCRPRARDRRRAREPGARPDRGRARARRLPARAARVADAARADPRRDPVHPDPALHGRRQPARSSSSRIASSSRWCSGAGSAPSRRIRAYAVRASGLEAPIGALLLAMLLSMAVNLPRVNAAGPTVVKNFTFFLSYLLVLYFIVSVIRSRRDLDRMIALLVGGGTIVALAALVEWRTSTNLFNWYSHVAPFLHYVDEGVAQARGSGVRARALGTAPDRAHRRSGHAAAARVLPVPAQPPPRLARLGGAPDARRAFDRLAHGHDHADRPAGELPVHQAARHGPAAARCCSRCSS